MVKSSNKNKTKNKQSDSLIKGIILHETIIVFIHLIAVMAVCVIFYAADIDVYTNFAIIAVLLAAANFVSAYFTGLRFRKKGMLLGLLYNSPICIIFILTSLILNSFAFDYRLFVLLAVFLVMSALGGITAVNTRIKNKRKR